MRHLERSRYWEDDDGADASSKRFDEKLPYAWDLDAEGLLNTGEQVTTWAYVDSGVTRSSIVTAAKSVSFNVLGVGETEITATTSLGRIHQRVARFYGSDRPLSDYQ